MIRLHIRAFFAFLRSIADSANELFFGKKNHGVASPSNLRIFYVVCIGCFRSCFLLSRWLICIGFMQKVNRDFRSSNPFLGFTIYREIKYMHIGINIKCRFHG